MYYHIEKLKFIKVNIGADFFKKIMRGKKFIVIPLEINPENEKTVNQNNAFIRLFDGERYIDAKIEKIVRQELYFVHLGCIIDLYTVKSGEWDRSGGENRKGKIKKSDI